MSNNLASLKQLGYGMLNIDMPVNHTLSSYSNDYKKLLDKVKVIDKLDHELSCYHDLATHTVQLTEAIENLKFKYRFVDNQHDGYGVQHLNHAFENAAYSISKLYYMADALENNCLVTHNHQILMLGYRSYEIAQVFENYNFNKVDYFFIYNDASCFVSYNGQPVHDITSDDIAHAMFSDNRQLHDQVLLIGIKEISMSQAFLSVSDKLQMLGESDSASVVHNEM